MQKEAYNVRCCGAKCYAINADKFCQNNAKNEIGNHRNKADDHGKPCVVVCKKERRHCLVGYCKRQTDAKYCYY